MDVTEIMRVRQLSSIGTSSSVIWVSKWVDQNSKGTQYPENCFDEELWLFADMIVDEGDEVICYTTKCGEKWRKGAYGAAQKNGQSGSLTVVVRFAKNKYCQMCWNILGRG